MPTFFVVSDLHLGETGLARMFHDHSQGMRFAELCSFVSRTPDSELLLLGDIFDVTASLPPSRGLGAFGRALELPIEDRPARPLAEICASIRQNNPVAQISVRDRKSTRLNSSHVSISYAVFCLKKKKKKKQKKQQ